MKGYNEFESAQHEAARSGFFIGLVVASFFWVAVVGVILVMWLG
jgi:hypothetical protein